MKGGGILRRGRGQRSWWRIWCLSSKSIGESEGGFDPSRGKLDRGLRRLLLGPALSVRATIEPFI